MDERKKPKSIGSEYQNEYCANDVANLEAVHEMNENLMKGRGKLKIYLHNKADYYNNMTSSNDLHYNIVPKQQCGSTPRKYNAVKKTYVPEQDFQKSYVRQILINEFNAIKISLWFFSFREISLTLV